VANKLDDPTENLGKRREGGGREVEGDNVRIQKRNGWMHT